MSSGLLATLDGVPSAVWELWRRAAATPGHPAAFCTLATVSQGGGGAVRMVVLRRASEEAGRLEFWTNRASAKVSDLASDPRAELLFWLPETQEQIRARVTVEVQDGTEDKWATLGQQSRRNYSAAPEPGARLTSPEDFAPLPAQSHFCILEARVTQLDVLSLAATPHRRVIFDDDGPRWVAP